VKEDTIELRVEREKIYKENIAKLTPAEKEIRKALLDDINDDDENVKKKSKPRTLDRSTTPRTKSFKDDKDKSIEIIAMTTLLSHRSLRNNEEIDKQPLKRDDSRSRERPNTIDKRRSNDHNERSLRKDENGFSERTVPRREDNKSPRRIPSRTESFISPRREAREVREKSTQERAGAITPNRQRLGRVKEKLHNDTFDAYERNTTDSKKQISLKPKLKGL